MRYLLLPALPLLLYSCNNIREQENITDSVIEAKNNQARAESANLQTDTMCYQYTSGKDVYTYRLVKKGNTISGTAYYDNFEKDDSHGTLSGTVEGNIMHLWYHFEAEGMNSVSEKYFKVTDEVITEGVGAIEVNADTSYFKDPAAIVYSGGLQFKKVDCN